MCIRDSTYAAYLWRLEHLGHNWNLIMASPVPPLDLFAAKFAVVTKLALLTHDFVDVYKRQLRGQHPLLRILDHPHIFLAGLGAYHVRHDLDVYKRQGR